MFRCRYCSGDCDGRLEDHGRYGCGNCLCRHRGDLKDGEIPIEGSSPA